MQLADHSSTTGINERVVSKITAFLSPVAVEKTAVCSSLLPGLNQRSRPDVILVGFTRATSRCDLMVFVVGQKRHLYTFYSL